MKLGLFGGTFDPPHVGHLVLADQCGWALGLDQVAFVPAYRPPHKLDCTLTAFEIRMEMVAAAIAGNAHFSVLPLERDQGGFSYTVDTLRALHASRPDDDLWLLVGEDSLDDLPGWRDPTGIAELARLAVYRRHGANGKVSDPLRGRVDFVAGPLVDVSSTEIRQLFGQGRSVRYLVPDGVLAIMEREHLYSGTADA